MNVNFSNLAENTTSTFDNSQTPFQMVYNLSKNREQWCKLQAEAIKLLLKRDPSPEELPTSCIGNLCALNLLLFGREKALNTKPLLNVTDTLTLELFNREEFVTLIKKASRVAGFDYNQKAALKRFDRGEKSVTLLDVCTGYLLSEENGREKEGDSKELLIKLGQEIAASLKTKTLQPEFLNYNSILIDRLFHETLNRQIEINDEDSIYYSIAIRSPIQELFSKEKKTHALKDFGFYHCFLIEQFLNKERLSADYRLYHSWQGKFDLNEHFSKIHRAENGQALNREQFEDFLANLKIAICPPLDWFDSDSEDSEFFHDYVKADDDYEKAEINCFSTHEDRHLPSPLYFNHKTQTIGGFTMRYLSTKISPTECLQNITAIWAEIMKDKTASD